MITDVRGIEVAEATPTRVLFHKMLDQPLDLLNLPICDCTGSFCDWNRRESETVARCATVGRSQDVGKGSRLSVEGERCAVSS